MVKKILSKTSKNNADITETSTDAMTDEEIFDQKAIQNMNSDWDLLDIEPDDIDNIDDIKDIIDICVDADEY